MARAWEHAIVARSGVLDRAWYLACYPDIAQSGTDPVLHYLDTGWHEGRDPSPGFNTDFYLREHPELRDGDTNPLAHYLSSGWRQGSLPREGFKAPPRSKLLPEICPLVIETVLGVSSPESEAEYRSGVSLHRSKGLSVRWPDVPSRRDAPATEPPGACPIRNVAFYLPQFHTIPENDAWWGQGFTEWENVRKGQPVFEGHHQPHVPGDFGYYELPGPGEHPEPGQNNVMRDQALAAATHGVNAFCFYSYWFAGKRLLESPVDAWLADRTLELDFCICWANENWTRTWDGNDAHVLIEQDHSAADDLDFIANAAKYLRDPRYLRVSGRPLLILYRPSLLPKPADTASRWRQWCRDNGIGEILLAYVQSFEHEDPQSFGFDFAIEFPPSNTNPVEVTQRVETRPGFKGTLFDGQELAGRRSHMSIPEYPLWRGTCPSWDNEARRPNRGTILADTAPDHFRRWSVDVGRDTLARFDNPSERLVFINAWNEWAEGSHLEPDQRYGYEWLHAVRDAQETLAGITSGTGPGVVVVAHDLQRNGAQMGSLALARELKSLGRRVEVVALGDGPMRREFESVTELTVLDDDADTQQARELAEAQVARGFTTAFCNSSVTGYFAQALHEAGAKVVGLVHELPGVLADPDRHARAAVFTTSVPHLVFPSEATRDAFPYEIPEATQITVRPQGRYRSLANPSPDSRERLRRRLGISDSARVVLGVGFGDHRKGPDLLARALAGLANDANGRDIHIVWLGEVDTSDVRIANALSAAPGTRLHLVGFVNDPAPFYAGADVLAIPSREDPYPSVALEALAAGLPVVAFRDRTGLNDLIADTNGVLVDKVSASALADGLRQALHLNGDQDKELRQAYVKDRFNYRKYVMDLLKGTPAEISRVSVVVPNYNYAGLIEKRLRQILAQDHPLYEVIVLDDASTDGSIERIRATLDPVDDIAWQLHVNSENSGSCYKQWAKGSEFATGDLIWIAEADDIAEPGFLAEIVPVFKNEPRVTLSYCESKQVDELGAQLAPNYLGWTDFGQRDYTRRYLKDGRKEIAECLSVKNTIPNVSAAVIRAEALREALRKAADLPRDLPTATDWWVYIQVLTDGLVSFTPTVLNSHRRHKHSVIAQNLGESHFREIAYIQREAATVVSPSEETTAAAKSFLFEIGDQLGLDAGKVQAICEQLVASQADSV